MSMNELLYDHQKALLQFQHSSPPEERQVHWPDVVLAASKLREWREANGAPLYGIPMDTTPLGITPTAQLEYDDTQPRGRMNEWESEGGALAPAHDNGIESPSDFIIISANQFFVAQTKFATLTDALAFTRRR